MSDSADAKSTKQATPRVAIERRPYSAPSLEHLGRVSDLTLGSAGGSIDAINTPTKQ